MRLADINTRAKVLSSPSIAAETLIETYHLIRRRVDRELRTHGISISRIKLLSELEQAREVRPSALAAELGLVPRSITDAVDSLEREGLVERRPDPLDRRAQLIAMTRDGVRALRAARKLRKRLLDEALAPLSQQKRDALVAILSELHSALEADGS